MAKIEFDKATRDLLSRKIADHLKQTQEVEVTSFDALDLLDFLSETLGPHYYNQGLQDAQVVIRDRLEGIADALYAIEKPLPKLR